MADKTTRDRDSSDSEIPELQREGDKPAKSQEKPKGRPTKTSKAAEKAAVNKQAEDREDTGNMNTGPEGASPFEAMMIQMQQAQQAQQQMMTQMMAGFAGAVGDFRKAMENGPKRKGKQHKGQETKR